MKKIIALFIVICLYSCSSDEVINNKIPQNLNFTEVYSITVDTLELDMISNSAENSLFLTYSTNDGLNENVLKYNLTNQIATNITHPDITESRQIEIIGNWIYSVSKNDIYRYDLNLNNSSLYNTESTGLEYHRTVINNSDIFSPQGMNLLFNYNTTTNTYQRNMQGFEYRLRADCEIYNNKIYAFGGSSYDNNQNPLTYNSINIYDITSNSWTQETLPFNVYESFTELYNSSIIVAGNKNTDSSNAFIGTYNPQTNTYTPLLTSLDLPNISIRSITKLNQDLYVAYSDLVSPTPAILTVKIVKTTLP